MIKTIKDHDFSGGVSFDSRTTELKEYFTVEDQTIRRFEPKKVYIPLQQHIGVPNEPVVEVGDQVKVGQLIAKNGEDAFVNAPVHASVSGKVVGFKELPNSQGQQIMTIVIKNDGLHTPTNQKDLSESGDVSQWLTRIQESGLAGMGGATFPTHVKLSVDETKKVTTIVLNGAECEPFLISDYSLMKAQGEQIIRGAKIAQKILNAEKVIIGIEDDKPEAIKAMGKAAEKFDHVTVAALSTSYPQGGEKQLLETVLKKEVPFGGLPVDTGGYLMNVATSKAVADAIYEGQALVRRYITVTGDVEQRSVVDFPMGTLVGDLLDFCGGFSGQPSKVMIGGPMMGFTIDSLDVPLTKASNGLVVINTIHDRVYEESPCIRCNRCVEVCPMRLEPQQLDLHFRAGNFDRCEELLAEACINCGACSYACPARRDLANKIRQAAAKVKELREEEEDA